MSNPGTAPARINAEPVASDTNGDTFCRAHNGPAVFALWLAAQTGGAGEGENLQDRAMECLLYS
jgi:hypothetical protein